MLSIRLQLKHSLLFILFLTSACATPQLADQKDYKTSVFYYNLGDYQSALKAFPKKEEKGFVTSVERGWLQLLTNEINTDRLLSVGSDLEKKDIIYISKEAEYFFNETKEGYFPAEHEVIWLHLITGLSFARQGKHEQARVEANKAAYFLQGHFSEHQGDFDDPSLRVLLAALWIYCGEWDHAQVDLRRASEMNPELKWAKRLSEQTNPPIEISIGFYGSGPNIKGIQWKDKNNKTGLPKIEFTAFPPPPVMTRLSETNPFEIPVLSTAGIYSRHQERNLEIRDQLNKSKYMIKSMGIEGLAAVSKTTGKLTAGTLIVTGVVLGVAIAGGGLYLLAEVGAAEGAAELAGLIILAGIGVGKFIVDQAILFDKNVVESTNQFKKETLDFSTTYRYVRYIPNYVYAYPQIDFLSSKVQLESNYKFQSLFDLQSVDKKTKINFFSILPSN